MSELIGKVLGNYHILEKIGRGGMASVYKALDLNHDQAVAVKVLSPQLAMEENFKARFEREAEVLRGLEHPNIVPILDYGEEGGLAYIIMPFMEVGTLSDLLENGGMTLDECTRIIDQVSSALQYAHDAGVVHRDVKPSNILIDEEGNAWLSDFGFAHVHDATLSLTGSALIGTPAYMAPEIVSGKPVTPRSDQYSLAVVLYHLSTGSLPYDAETPMAIAISHVNRPLPNPRLINPDLSRSIEAVLLKALAKNDAYRYTAISQFNQAFQEAVAQENERSEKRQNGSLFDRTLVTLDELQTNLKGTLRRPNFARRMLLIGALLLLMVFPVAASGPIKVLPSDVGGDEIAGSGEVAEELRATIYALYTANAPGAGTPFSSNQIATIVAQTLSAMEAEIANSNSSATPTIPLTATPTGWENLASALTETASNMPTATSTVEWVYVSPTPRRGVSKPPPASPTPQPTEPPPASPTSQPPPPTQPPPPEKTKGPEKCNPDKPPGHPKACPSDSSS